MKKFAISVLLVTLLIAFGLVIAEKPETLSGPECSVRIGEQLVRFDQEQAKNAATIAAVGKRLGLPNRSVTIALATAWQESKLRNIDYGDRDSIGLFQQRPSMGWGSESQIMSPEYAATKFFQGLAEVDGWQNMRVTDAAQAVQASAYPEAYAEWEDKSRLMARALTGEVPAAFSCRHDVDQGGRASSQMRNAIENEFGRIDLDQAQSEARGWLLASWLIGHSQQYEIENVTFNAKQWTASSGEWSDHPDTRPIVRFNT